MSFERNKEYYLHPGRTILGVGEEIEQGLSVLSEIKHPLVGVFGSHITKPGTPEYEHCRAVAKLLGEKGYGILTGGGPGIMQAANQGAMDAGVPSVGLRMTVLSNERVADTPYTHTVDFHYMFVRRFILSIKSSALLFYPGGFGTLNELFEFIVLMQTNLADKVPAILVNREYWQGMMDWLRESMLPRGLLPNLDEDIRLLHMADTPEEILHLVCDIGTN